MLPSDLQFLTDEDLEEIGMPCCQDFGCAALTTRVFYAPSDRRRADPRGEEAAAGGGAGGARCASPASLASTTKLDARSLDAEDGQAAAGTE